MGNRIGAFLARPIRNFNIENRVQKVVGAEKPKSAPRHPSDQKYEAQVAIDKEKVIEKREDLLERLKSVKVVSAEATPEPEKAERVLPQSRQSWQQYQYGYYEPETVQPGRITLRQATQLVSDGAADPARFTPEALAAQYGLRVEDVRSVLKYFKPFQVYTPEVDLAEKLGVKKLKEALRIPGLQTDQTQVKAKALLEEWKKKKEEEK
ncbi:NADH dehydrogenase [ubiquinone] 1 alpha subcomplex assembly factor 4 [Ixodes scapularis]|uniref:NADH dehydrogenase [ubiquinone] 1 alpha subcomplex assembly factor 4 n=1 Tax=Ixodes scapularis TaxID=6945 RepID=UPI001A9D895B|nr:NADH dehydrogenase [ubiquinone] 1 alpha subcomplex assembly factor 4 [Ixodes scapularis]